MYTVIRRSGGRRSAKTAATMKTLPTPEEPSLRWPQRLPKFGSLEGSWRTGASRSAAFKRS